MRINLREDVTYQPPGASLQLDREKGIVRGCKFLGTESRNGRLYLPESTAESLNLYEGAKSNLDHPDGNGNPSRSVKDRFGRARNVERRANGEVWGDFHFNPKHSFAETFCWWVENDPTAIGFSHNAEGDGEHNHQTGLFEVRKVTKVHSIDLVADPATTRGISEAQGQRTMKFREWVLGSTKLDTVKRERLRKLCEMDAVGDMAMPDTATPDADPDEAMRGGFEQACIALIQKVLSGDLDMKEGLSKVKAMLKAHETASTGTTPADDEPAEKMESLKSENKSLKLRLDELELKERERTLTEECRAQCKTLGLPEHHVTPVFLEQLTAHQDADKRKALIEDRRSVVLGERQRHQDPKAPPVVPEGKNLTEEQKQKAQEQEFEQLFRKLPEHLSTWGA